MANQLPQCVLERLKREPVTVGTTLICARGSGDSCVLVCKDEFNCKHVEVMSDRMPIAIACIEHAWQERLDQTSAFIRGSGGVFDVCTDEGHGEYTLLLGDKEFNTRLEALCAALDWLEKRSGTPRCSLCGDGNVTFPGDEPCPKCHM